MRKLFSRERLHETSHFHDGARPVALRSGVGGAEQEGNSGAPKWHVPAAVASRPNIVVIMADDHGRQAISCYGSKLIQTPNIDRLARDGMRFTDAMANNSICSPSRATMLTGKYNHLCGVKKLEGHFDGTQQTFPKLLQQAGYQTAIVGKWHLYSEPTGFDFYSVLPGQGRYYDCRSRRPASRGETATRGRGAPGLPYRRHHRHCARNGWKTPARIKPFCLLIHHKAPHSPHDPAPRHKDLFKDTVSPSRRICSTTTRAGRPSRWPTSWRGRG